MYITTLPRRQNEGLEEDVKRLETAMAHFGLTLAMTKQVPLLMKEFVYETKDQGGIIAHYRLDGSPKLQVKVLNVKHSDIPLPPGPFINECDNILYSVGMRTELFNSICAYLLR